MDSRFQQTEIRDKKKMNVLEAVSRMVGGDLLSVCVPEGGQVSETFVDSAKFPSRNMVRTGGIHGDDGDFMAENLVRTGAERVLLSEYGAHFFTNFLTGEGKEFQYEQEYLLQGTNSDRENLKKTVNQLIAVREAMNLITLFGSPEKRAEVKGMALMITGAAGLSPLSQVISFFIMTVWAFAEAVEDVRILLSGGKIPFLKTGDEWRTSLTSLAENGAGVWAEDVSAGERGLDYQGWLEVFFLMEGKSVLCGRMMDMIQNNICIQQPDFRMEKCAFRLDAELSGQGPLVPMRRRCRKEY